MKKKLLLYAPLLTAVAIALVLVLMLVFGVFSSNGDSLITSSTLVDAIAVEELNVSRFTYKGIATTQVGSGLLAYDCHIMYTGTVTASVKLSDISFDFDHKQKIVTVTLPAEEKYDLKCEIADNSPLSFIPKSTGIDPKEAYQACREDISGEAKNTDDLYELGEESLKDLMSSFVMPILEQKGYTANWVMPIRSATKGGNNNA